MQPFKKRRNQQPRRRHVRIQKEKRKERRSIDLRTSRQANSSSSARMLYANTVRNNMLHSLDTSRSRRRGMHVRQICLRVVALKPSSHRISKDTSHYPNLSAIIQTYQHIQTSSTKPQIQSKNYTCRSTQHVRSTNQQSSSKGSRIHTITSRKDHSKKQVVIYNFHTAKGAKIQVKTKTTERASRIFYLKKYFK